MPISESSSFWVPSSVFSLRNPVRPSRMADTILKMVGPKRPGLAMSIIGWFVSIPVFCDSGYVILSALRKSVTHKAKVSATMMSVALATGLYASHTLGTSHSRPHCRGR